MKTKTIAALALTALAGASLVGCSAIEEAISAPAAVSLEAGTYDHNYSFGDDLGQRLVVDDKGNVGHTTYSCQGQTPALVKQQTGTVEGDQIVFTGSDGSETGRADLWQAHPLDPETEEADLDKPLRLFDIDGTTFRPAWAQSPCE